jgi:hypothetical protein
MSTVIFDIKSSNLGLTDEDIEKAEKGGGGSKFMEQGVHSVKIVEAGFHANKESKQTSCKSDASWHNVKVVMENSAGQQYTHYVQIPTSKLTFTINTAKGPKESAFMFVKFKQFCAALGESVSADAALVLKVLKKLFADPSKMIGKTLEIDLGYSGPYLQYLGKEGDASTYSVMKLDGSILLEGPYDAKKAEIETVKKTGKGLSRLEIRSFTSKVVVHEDQKDKEKEEW